MFFTINIYSKNLNSLNNFLSFFNNKIMLNKLKIKILKILPKKVKKKRKFAVLKSPHVNKTAQEQFEFEIYKNNFTCFTNQPFLFIILFKSLRFKYVSDVFVSIKFKSDIRRFNKKIKLNLSSDNFYIEKFTYNLLINHLKLLETYGELLVKKDCLDSSVG